MKKIELSEEELFELTNQIALVEYYRGRDDYRRLYSKDDLVQDVLYHFYKYDLKGLENKSKKHIENTIYLQCRNTVFTSMRNLSSKYSVVNKSLDEEICEDVTLLDSLPCEDKYTTLELLELNESLNKINNETLENYLIKYKGKFYKCNYKNIAILFYIIYSDRKILAKDLKGFILDSRGCQVDFKMLQGIINKFKYIVKRDLGIRRCLS